MITSRPIFFYKFVTKRPHSFSGTRAVLFKLCVNAPVLVFHCHLKILFPVKLSPKDLEKWWTVVLLYEQNVPFSVLIIDQQINLKYICPFTKICNHIPFRYFSCLFKIFKMYFMLNPYSSTFRFCRNST